MQALAGRVLTARGWVLARVVFDARIRAIEPLIDAPCRYVLPGFIDLHVHGGGGGDAMEGEAGVRRMARFHARHGTTALLATTCTAPPGVIVRALEGIRAVAPRPEAGEARVLGAHLEGPFIHPERLGAQPPYPHPPDPAWARRFLEAGPVRVVTLAPELGGALELVRFLAGRGVRVQLGHSTAGFAEAQAALEAGAVGFTHLFNAMGGLMARAPGLVGAAFARGRWAEVIPDGRHVHPGALLAAFRAIPGVYGVTDAVAAAGMPEGRYSLGARTVVRRGDGVYLEDGTLAGSVLTMAEALRNLVRLGRSLAEAAWRLSALPAAYLGVRDRGRVRAGAWADLVVLDEALRVREVYVEGRRVG